jgi:hypothetical protein
MVESRRKEVCMSQVYELRTYTTHPGRLAALQSRFQHHTNRLLEKHGMKLLGFWTPTDPAQAGNTLIYLVAHPSEEEGRRHWDNFRADPDWRAARDQSEQDGPIVLTVTSVYLTPTAYSALQ